jgi:hypothetical protein
MSSVAQGLIFRLYRKTERAFSGFRDQTLGDLSGIYGLKINDFPEITIANGTVEFNAIPAFVVTNDDRSR